MKLLSSLRRPVPEAVAPAAASPPAAPPALQMLAYARSELADEEFNAQTAALRSLLELDSGTGTWHARLPLDQPELAAQVLAGLVEAARAHGTTVQVRLQPGGDAPAAAG